MTPRPAALGLACALVCAPGLASAQISGGGTAELIPQPPGSGYGVALPAGPVGTRLYTTGASDSVTYTVEPATQCGAAAPDTTLTVSSSVAAGVAEVTGPNPATGVRTVVCVTAIAGAPHYRAY